LHHACTQHRRHHDAFLALRGACHQDFEVHPENILKLWRVRKLSHAECMRQLTLTRCANLQSLIDNVRYVQQLEHKQEWVKQRLTVTRSLASLANPFLKHDVVENWKMQYTSANYGVERRFKILVLRGESMAGKSSFAESLFGEENTLVLNCQGLESDLPSLRDFDRSQHRCIVFDEAVHTQVLNNKSLFQAGKNMVWLGQSRCGAFAYSVWPYQIAMVCCSNMFPVTQAEGLHSAEDEDWMTKNVVVVELPKNACWYTSAFAKVMDVAEHCDAAASGRLCYVLLPLWSELLTATVTRHALAAKPAAVETVEEHEYPASRA